MGWKCDVCDSFNEDSQAECFVCGAAKPKTAEAKAYSEIKLTIPDEPKKVTLTKVGPSTSSATAKKTSAGTAAAKTTTRTTTTRTTTTRTTTRRTSSRTSGPTAMVTESTASSGRVVEFGPKAMKIESVIYKIRKVLVIAMWILLAVYIGANVNNNTQSGGDYQSLMRSNWTNFTRNAKYGTMQSYENMSDIGDAIDEMEDERYSRFGGDIFRFDINLQDTFEQFLYNLQKLDNILFVVVDIGEVK